MVVLLKSFFSVSMRHEQVLACSCHECRMSSRSPDFREVHTGWEVHMYQVEYTRENEEGTHVAPPSIGYVQGMLCWPGLLVQNVMVVLLLLDSGTASWSPEVRKQASSTGYTWLYSGIFWLFTVGLCATMLVA